jgi:hypothetical protein
MNFRLSIVDVCHAEEICKQLLSYGTRMSGNFLKTQHVENSSESKEQTEKYWLCGSGHALSNTKNIHTDDDDDDDDNVFYNNSYIKFTKIV